MPYSKGEATRDFGMWPRYSAACRRDVDALLRKGGSLSAYRSNPEHPVGPREGSWAWRLEREAERMFGARHVIACNSGTMALQAALHALAVPRGGEVITTPYTFSATTAAIVHAGLTPVFADVDEWGCLDLESAKLVANLRTVAILPVDLFGHVAADRFHGQCRRRLRCFPGPPLPLDFGGVPVIEDACQAVGAKGKLPAGQNGAVGAFSFNGAKNVPAGEAGALVTADDALAHRARLWISHGENFGWSGDGDNWGRASTVGLNGRLNELTACVAYHGLRSVLANNARRRELARVLRRSLSGRTDLALPDEDGHALYVYPVILAEGVDRAAFVKGMRAGGIEVGEGYIRPPLHQYPAFRQYQRIPLPMVEALSERRLCLLSQVRPPATIEDMRYLGDSIAAVLDGRAGRLPRRRVGHIRDSVF